MGGNKSRLHARVDQKLWKAVNTMDVPRAMAAIQKGADANCVGDDEARTPLMLAAIIGDQMCLGLLLQAGADVNVTDMYGNTALVLAAKYGHCRCLEAFVKAGANVNHVNALQNTALILATRNNHVDCVNALLWSGADVNAANACDLTGFMWEAENGNKLCFKIYKDRERRGNSRGIFRICQTALGIAMVQEQEPCVRLLLAAGADVNEPAWCKGHRSGLRYMLRVKNSKTLKHLPVDPEDKFSLRHICRELIRHHLMKMNSISLFVRVPQLGLPKSLASYLVYDVSRQQKAGDW